MANRLRAQTFPLGATVYPSGVNFSVYSKGSTAIELLFYDDVNDLKPSRSFRLDPRSDCIYHYWHIFVPDIGAGQIYGYRARGPFNPQEGLRFDSNKVLLDPYGKCVAWPSMYDRQAMCEPHAMASAIKSVVVDPATYDWEDDTPPRRPFAKSVIYEMHVGGFTKHHSSGVTPVLRGTYSGLVEKIPYLRDLGITAVELLPVFAFDVQDCRPGLVNYWGYSPMSFFAPHPGYCSRHDPTGAMNEFRDMVKALHRAGIEVFLDVVYNHTAEVDASGPTFCFRGLSNQAYYILEEDKSIYANYTGCGNTLNANHPICRRMILDSLRYWVSEMHVDGFRFDLASVLSRDGQGRPMASPPVLWDIESDPVLSNVKLIAEPWDAVGLYEVGGFAGDSWKEWNGHFQDDIRSFVKGDSGMAGAVAFRLTGSPDIYQHKEHEPDLSINYITCHDGFTLNDLVSYNTKHNEANGENNRDGSDANKSWNCGVEGPTDDPKVERLRNRQVKNFLTLSLLSVGTPMLLSGDEVCRSQGGNNNAYCQDNETSWLNWTLLEKHADILRFTQHLIAMRLNPDIPLESLHVTLSELLRRQPIQWHGVKLDTPDWSPASHSLAATFRITHAFEIHIMINAYWEKLTFDLPPSKSCDERWRLVIDTFRESPDDICNWCDALPLVGASCAVQPRSIVLFIRRYS